VRTCVLAASALYVSCAMGADMPVLRVDGSEAGMQGLLMSLDGEFAGVVGDAIAIPPSNHDLVVELPSGLRVSYQIAQTNGRFQATALTDSGCVGSTSWSTRSAPLPLVEQNSPEPSLRLSQVQVNLEGLCPLELPNLSCYWRQASLEIHSVPEVGAEVWIDGVQVSGATSKVMSLGYCGGTSPRVALVLRKAGYTTCRATVRIEDEHGPYTLGCQMHKL
jgi:hypothetical protein